jgi:hypothetical protein
MLERAEHFFRTMKTEHGLAPDAVACTTYLLCLLRSRQGDSYQKGKALVEEMIVRSADGDQSAAPDTTKFVTLLAMVEECTALSKAAKLIEVDYIIAMLHHLNVKPSPGILQEVHKIRVASR